MWSRAKPSATDESLLATVSRVLGDADQETLAIVTAIAGLLAAVAYADSDWTPEETQVVHDHLLRVRGIDAEGAKAISDAAQRHKLQLSTADAPTHARALRERGDRELRFQVLELLLSVAAADGVIELAEVNVMRTLTQALGLSQQDYNAAQDAHRDKLSFVD